MTEKPLVSILMTAYNREKYIAEAIESVLVSSYQNFEIIITDNCSTDKTFEIAKSYEAKDSRIKVYLNETNLGQFPNRNRAASYAKGKYIKYLDSDDIIYPHSLEIMVNSMEIFPEAGLGLTFNKYKDNFKLPNIFTSAQAFEYQFYKDGLLYIGPSGCIYNREHFFNIGAFKDYGVASDYEINLRACFTKPIVLLQRDLVYWRRHEGQEIKRLENKYLELNYKIHKEIISNANCPLNENQKKEVLININKNHARKIIKSILKFRFKKSFFIYKITKIPISSFFYALIPVNIRKKII